MQLESVQLSHLGMKARELGLSDCLPTFHQRSGIRLGLLDHLG